MSTLLPSSLRVRSLFFLALLIIGPNSARVEELSGEDSETVVVRLVEAISTNNVSGTDNSMLIKEIAKRLDKGLS